MRKLTCIICPRGCELTVDTNARTVTGNTCPRGEKYGLEECIHPMRTVTSTVAVENRPGQFLSVKTSAPVPKEKIFEVMAQIHSHKAVAPVKIHDIIIENVCGAHIVATRNME